jgi:hypothetical protein
VVGGAEGRKRRQIHVGPEKVGTSFCLHFVLFSSRDIVQMEREVTIDQRLAPISYQLIADRASQL